MASKSTMLRNIPGVDELLKACAPEIEEHGRDLVVHFLREVSTDVRARLSSGGSTAADRVQLTEEILAEAHARLASFIGPSLRRVINATGVILHTGLGRAPFSDEVRQQIDEVLASYCSLEFDLTTGERGDRTTHVRDLLCYLTGAEDACVVNNNAAAVFLCLNTICESRETIVGRNQMIEIGGSFRIPDIMAKSGAILREVGTTNRVHLHDYEQAICDQTGALLLVHTSNYRILGFTHEAGIRELAELGEKHAVPVIHDLGGGILVDLQEFGLPHEPVVRESIAAGTSLVTFSGDKVLGASQSGVIVGKAAYIQKIKKNPLMRTLRCDKLALALLEATLRLFLKPDELAERHRIFSVLTESPARTRQRARRVLRASRRAHESGLHCEVLPSEAQMGSGALPIESFPSYAVAVAIPGRSPQWLARHLREATPSVVGYVKDDRVMLDMKVVLDDEVRDVVRALLHLNQPSKEYRN